MDIVGRNRDWETMLIVDDAPLNRAILSNIFEEQYQIIEAGNGREALDTIRTSKSGIAAVLLDVVMPEMDGLEVLIQMDQDGLLTQIPVFLVTSETDHEIMRKAYALGVMDVISKPVVPYLVERRVNSVVELFRVRQSLSAEVERQRDQLLFQAEKMAEMSMGMVEALSTAIEFRSDESGEHVRRIHDITTYLLRNSELGAGFTEEEIKMIGIGSITHDVGKISITDAILHKPGRLTAEEYEIMKTHTVKGAELLSTIPQMRAHTAYQYAYDIALHHHERWDGNGYPEGLVGDQISIWSQIVSLADVYDALVSVRCYKKAYSPENAMELIETGQCGVFNPKLLECFKRAEPTIRKLYEKK